MASEDVRQAVIQYVKEHSPIEAKQVLLRFGVDNVRLETQIPRDTELKIIEELGEKP